MKYLCIFIFTLGSGRQYKIVSRSMKQARRILERLTSHASKVIHIEVRIRISLNPKSYAKNLS